MLERLNHASRATKQEQHIKQRRARPSIWLRLLTLLLACVACFLIYIASSVVLYPQIAKASCIADTILVMGAAQYNGIPSPAFQRRLDKALELYQSGCGSSLIVTGGSQVGDNYSEGITGAAYLYSLGVPKEALLSETHSTTSFENLVFSKELTDKRQFTIVTDDLHAFRTLFLAKRLGFQVEVVPVKAQGNRWEYGFSEFLKVTVFHFGFIR